MLLLLLCNALFVPGYQLILTLTNTDNMISEVVPDNWPMLLTGVKLVMLSVQVATDNWGYRGGGEVSSWGWGRHQSLTLADTLSNQTRRCAPSHHNHILHCFPYTFHLSSFISSFIRLENEALVVTCILENLKCLW